MIIATVICVNCSLPVVIIVEAGNGGRWLSNGVGGSCKHCHGYQGMMTD